MASAARVHIAERGRDPRRYVLLATGGAGPVHVWYLAARLGIERVVCPPSAGVASALGLLLAPARSGSGARTSGSSSSCPRDRTRGLPREPSRMRSGRPASGLSPGCRRESGPRGSTSTPPTTQIGGLFCLSFVQRIPRIRMPIRPALRADRAMSILGSPRSRCRSDETFRPRLIARHVHNDIEVTPRARPPLRCAGPVPSPSP